MSELQADNIILAKKKSRYPHGKLVADANPSFLTFTKC